MATVTVKWDWITQKRKVDTWCNRCGRRLVRTIAEGYSDNGLHNEQETRAKNEEKLSRRQKDIEEYGVRCTKCGDKPLIDGKMADKPAPKVVRIKPWKGPKRYFYYQLDRYKDTAYETRTELADKLFHAGLGKLFCDGVYMQLPYRPDSDMRVVVIDDYLLENARPMALAFRESLVDEVLGKKCHSRDS